MIIRHWNPEFRKLYGESFPSTYMAVDCEYTGGNEEKDLIMEIGHVLVRDHQVVDRGNYVLNWSNHHVVPERWTREALKRIESRMMSAGRKWRITWDVMQNEGVKAEKVFEFYYELFTSWKDQGGLFVAHNGFYADERMLKGAFEGFLTKDFSFGENQLFDTGAIEKASQCLISDNPSIQAKRSVWLPMPGDTLRSYFLRVTRTPAKHIHWSTEFCAKKYRLIERFQLDQEQHHRAGFDAYLSHLLMQEYCALAAAPLTPEERQGPGPLATSADLAREMEKGLAEAKAVVQEEPEPLPVRRRKQRVV